jgi:KDO2-lipid IV(A) lauroyltransferase
MRLLGRLPLVLLYIISDIFFLINYYIIGYRKNIVIRNLKIAFPEYSNEEFRKIRRNFYRNFGDVIVETLKGLYIGEKELKKRVKFTGLEIIEEAKNQNQNVVVFSAHQGNWEWSMQSATIQFPMEFHGIYKPLKNKDFDKLIFQIRTRFGGILIPKDKVARNIIKNKGKCRVIGIIGDQRPFSQAPKYWAKFFDTDTAFFPGLNQIPMMANGVAVFVKVVRVRRGYYENEIIKIGEPPYMKNNFELLDNYIKETEDMIRESPGSWLWSHNRWKYGKDE